MKNDIENLSNKIIIKKMKISFLFKENDVDLRFIRKKRINFLIKNKSLYKR